LAGLLNLVGKEGSPPIPPPGLLGDFGGAGMGLAFGVLAALYERQASGKGQVIDCSMVESSAILGTLFYGMLGANFYHLERGANTIDGGSHFYNSYQTSDGQWLTIAAVLPKFYQAMMAKLGLSASEPAQMDESQWPAMKEKMAAIFKQHTLAEWNARLDGADYCYAPALNMRTAPLHPHNQARKSFVEVDGITQPAPAPKFSRTPGAVAAAPPATGEHTEAILQDWGFSSAEIASLHQSGTVKTAMLNNERD
jgi:alpha-methylacyl-CoA racemase